MWKITWYDANGVARKTWKFNIPNVAGPCMCGDPYCSSYPPIAKFGLLLNLFVRDLLSIGGQDHGNHLEVITDTGVNYEKMWAS